MRCHELPVSLHRNHICNFNTFLYFGVPHAGEECLESKQGLFIFLHQFIVAKSNKFNKSIIQKRKVGFRLNVE